MTAEEKPQEIEIPAGDKPKKKKKQKPLRLPPEQWKIAQEIADTLGETEKGPRFLVADIILHCGVEFAQDVLRQTIEIEAKDGLLTNNKSRRRTMGGVFFYVAKGRLEPAVREKIFPDRKKEEQARQLALPPFEWANRAQVFAEIQKQGKAEDVRVVVIGHPGDIVKRQNLVIAKMKHEAPLPSLPKGVPPIPEDHNTEYTIYMGYEQWGKAEKTLGPDKVLVIEGLSIYDPEIPGIAVFATAIKTRKQKSKYANADGQTAKPSPKDRADKKPRQQRPMPEPEAAPVIPVQLPPAPNVVIPDGAPPAVAQKLHELHSAAQQFREKIALLEAKPANQRFGLEMTQKLLANTEKQIEALVARYS